MKENMSPGVYGISTKIIKETVENISTPLAHVFHIIIIIIKLYFQAHMQTITKAQRTHSRPYSIAQLGNIATH